MGVPCRPVVTQAAAGAGHWAAGRLERALERAGAAGFGLVAWGLGTEAPTVAEVQEHFWLQQGEIPTRKLGTGQAYRRDGKHSRPAW